MNLERQLNIPYRQHIYILGWEGDFEEYEVLLAKFDRGVLLLLFTFVSE